MTLTVVDERAVALDQLNAMVKGDRKYVVGKYLFTRVPIWELPWVDIELPPKPDIGATWESMIPVNVIPRYRHRFNAIRVRERWFGYFHDEKLGRDYVTWRQDVQWWAGWMAYLRGGPRP